MKTDICEFFEYFKTNSAKNLNNPTSSRTIDRHVIERNKQRIFKGLIESLLIKALKKIEPFNKLKINKIIAPTSGDQ